MKKVLREITTELQTLCHEGMADAEIGIKVLDGFYKIGRIKKEIVSGENTREVFVIEAEV